MASLSERLEPPPPPDVSHLVTEDDVPVDNFISEKQQRLLTSSLYDCWEGPPPALEEGEQQRSFLAAANVAYYATTHSEAIVPDVMVSADVELPPGWMEEERRCYMLWEFGKVPELALEIVSNTQGDELGQKRQRYARMRFPYYVVYDPMKKLGDALLTCFELHGHVYRSKAEPKFELLGLSLQLWEGRFENTELSWLRWATFDGTLLPTGAERAETEKQRAETEKQRAETEKQRAETAEAEAARLRALLAAAGINPDNGS